MTQTQGTQLNFSGFSTGVPPSVGTACHGADWKTLMTRLEALGPDQIVDRSETARRIIREQGVTCHVPGDSGGEDCPWDLDIMPLAISAAEWESIESGITQRARLLNLILCDLYGSQHSLRNGWVPAPLVYANPNYLRGCQAVRIPGDNYIPFVAFDLARSQEGRWWVLADRTQAPAGIGFALENRTIVSRVLPEAINALQPRSVESVVPLVRETLVNLSRENRHNPTIVVLTPGRRSESYFEHAYMARALGCTLVEGGDLTVRDRRVYIKTLEGLRQVDVILRRVNDVFCDPLEFRSSSLLGVPGLQEAVRAGHVSLANALGCGIVESPALLAFLPNLCHQLLGEELRIPSVATWWCGSARELKHVSANLDRLILRPAFTLVSETGVATGLQRQLSAEQLVAQPHHYVGQEAVILSQIPALKEDRFGTAPFILRVFAIGDGTTYRVMPGGLARLPQRRRVGSMALSLSGGSKDVWVLPNGVPATESEPAVNLSSVLSQRAPIDLPSSAADNLFWMGRYSERLEHLLRTTRCVIGHLAENVGASGLKRLVVLSDMLKRLGIAACENGLDSLPDELAKALFALISETGHTNGVRDLIERIHGMAFAVRDRLSADTWRLLTRLGHDAALESGGLTLVAASSTLDTLVLDLAAFSGMEMENMTRGHGWRFLDIGRRMERTLNLLELLRVALTPIANSELLYEPLLDICDSVITYRRRHFAEMRLHGVLQLLLLEPDNPRSLLFQLSSMETTAVHLPEAPNPEGVAKVRRLMSALISRLHALEIEEIEPAASLHIAHISAHLTDMFAQVQEVSDLLTQVYFSHILPRVNQ